MNNLRTEKNNINKPKNISVFNMPIISKNQILNKKSNRPLLKKNPTKIFLNEPLIFNKKESSIKTLRYINNDMGKMRHFTPGAQE